MKKWSLLLFFIVTLALQGMTREHLQRRQEREALVIQGSDTQGMSADLAVSTLALGAFRGLVCNYLWLRSIALREQGRTYEARQIAEQIGRLQPRLPEVWSYLGSHLAYDLAATENTPAGRWRWIQSGISLLRDQGLRYNPDAPELYLTISRIYQDKIGAPMDDFHQEFKGEHRKVMIHALGLNPSLEELAGAPEQKALLAHNAKVRALIEAAEAVGLDLPLSIIGLEFKIWKKDLPPPAHRAFLDQWRDSEPYQLLLLSVRREYLWKTYRMDPRRMVEIDRAWGPLNWHGSDATAIYWALEGSRVAKEQGDLRLELRGLKFAMQAMVNAMRRGSVTELPGDDVYFAPQLTLIPRIEALYVRHLQMAGDKIAELEARGDLVEEEELPPGETRRRQHSFFGRRNSTVDQLAAATGFMRNQRFGQEGFFSEAVLLYSQYGRDVEGPQLLARARELYPDNPSFKLTYETYLITYMTERFTDVEFLEDQTSMSQLIEGTWFQAFQALALNQDARFKAMERLAHACRVRWERYLKSQLEEDPSIVVRQRVHYDVLKRRGLHRAGRSFGRRGELLRRQLAVRAGVKVSFFDGDAPPLPRRYKRKGPR